MLLRRIRHVVVVAAISIVGLVPTTGPADATVVIPYNVPAPALALTVKDAADDSHWDGTETPGSKAYGAATFLGDPNPLPMGVVTYNIYSDDACSVATDFSDPQTINAGDGSVPPSSDSSSLGAGTYSMKAFYSGDNNYDADHSDCVAFAVVKASQAITFSSSAPAPAVVGGSYIPSASATPSGLTVHFKVDSASDPGVCSFASGTLSFNDVGNCILDANQEGNATYGAAPQQQQPITVYPRSGGSMTRSVAFVPAGATHKTIKFTYTAPAGGMAKGTVRLTVPDGWSEPSRTGSAPGFSRASTGARSISGRTIVVSGVSIPAGGTLVITYGATSNGGHGATVTTATGSEAWTVSQRSTTVGNTRVLGSPPSITVVAADGSGLMTPNTTGVTHDAAHQTMKFTYTVWPGGMRNGKIALTVPAGWSAPSKTSSAHGYVTISGAGTIAIAGRTITVSGITQAAGTTLVITYGSRAGGGPGATTPSTTGPQRWTVKQQSLSNSTLTKLNVQPKIKVK